jgi:hypothetical protein
MPFRFVTGCALLIVSSASVAPWWESGPMVSYWYAPDNNWPAAVAQVSKHRAVVTSVMSYCGIDIADNGTLILDFRYPAKRCMVVYGTPRRPDPRDSVARRARSFYPLSSSKAYEQKSRPDLETVRSLQCVLSGGT